MPTANPDLAAYQIPDEIRGTYQARRTLICAFEGKSVWALSLRDRPAERVVYLGGQPVGVFQRDNRVGLYRSPDGHPGDRLTIMVREWLRRGLPGRLAQPTDDYPIYPSA